MTANVKKGTKKYKYLYWTYFRYKGHELKDVYKTCSKAKKDAELAIKREMVDEDGRNYHICSANCNFFTCGYETKDFIVVRTASHRYVLEK